MLDQSSSANILYSKKDYKRFKNLLKLQTYLMGIVGQRPYIIEEWFPHSLRRLGRFLAYLYGGIFFCFAMITTVLLAKKTIDEFQSGKLSQACDALTQAIIYAGACFSTCFYLWHANTLRNFLNFINKNYWHHSLVGLTYVSSFDSYLTARRITIFWVCLGFSGTSFFGIGPLLQGSHTLPLNCWYPFDPLQPSVFPFVYTLQMILQFNIGLTYTSSSSFYVSLIVLMLGQFDLLFCSLKNLQHHAELHCGENLNSLREYQERLPAPKDDEVNQYIFSEEKLTDLEIFRQMPKNLVSSKLHFQAALRESITKCVQLHQFICESCKILESLYHPYCLFKSLQLSFQLCLLVFVGVIDDRSTMRIFNLFQYFALTLFDLSLYTVFGELLRQHSVRAGEALWRSDWTSYAKIIRKDLMIFLINSQRPIILTAGKFFSMDISRMRSVVMQAFSFFTLLQKLAAKNN